MFLVPPYRPIPQCDDGGGPAAAAAVVILRTFYRSCVAIQTFKVGGAGGTL